MEHVPQGPHGGEVLEEGVIDEAAERSVPEPDAEAKEQPGGKIVLAADQWMALIERVQELRERRGHSGDL